MFGHRLFVFFFLIIVVAVAALIHPSGGADATLFRPGTTVRLCQDDTAEVVVLGLPSFDCTISTLPNTALDTVTSLDIASPDANFGAVLAYTPQSPDSASGFTIADDAAIANGAIVGELSSQVTLGLGAGNSGCFSRIIVNFTFIDATTDFLDGGAVDPTKLIDAAGPSDNRLLNLGEDDGDLNNDQQTILTATAAVNATSLDVENSSGLVVNETVHIGPANKETKVIDTIPNATTITLKAGLTSEHLQGEYVVTPDVAAFTFNGIPDGADAYPTMLSVLLDPDGPGPTLPITPRARYLGVAVVPEGATGTVVILQFLVFNPSDLRLLVGGGGAVASKGFGTLTVLQDPTQAPINGPITDFCTPLSATTHLDGTTRDNLCTAAAPDPDCFFTVQAGGSNRIVLFAQEAGASGSMTTACSTSPDECGDTRFSSTGAGTATFVSQAMSLRGLDDGDNIENALDSCPFTDSSGWDPRSAGFAGDSDFDGLPDDCDPDSTVTGFNLDEDGDKWGNRLDLCALEPNGDTETFGLSTVNSTSITVDSAASFPANAAANSSDDFEVDISSGTQLERKTVIEVSGTTFNLGSGLAFQHLSQTAVAQIFKTNVNFGQGDFDIPFPSVVLEGSRGDIIAPACDTGTVGGDTLTTDAPQGHFHRTATLTRVCIGDPPADDDGDGVCNGQEPSGCVNDSDCDGDLFAVGEAERIYRDGDNSGDVSDGDTRMNRAGNFVPGTVTCAGHTDCGNALVGFEADEKHTDDENTNTDYDFKECIYRDVDNSGDVTSGDIRLRVDVAPDVPAGAPGGADASPECDFAPQSVVACSADSDCTENSGLGLVPFDANEKHFDSRVPAAGLTETAYRDIFQTCTNRADLPNDDDGDFLVDLADDDCLGLHFDTFDNCIDTANPAPSDFTQEDLDWDGIGDACDSFIDIDVDGSSDSLERHVGIGADTVCSRTSAGNDEPIDAQTVDLNDDRSVTGADLSLIAAAIGKNVPPAPVRRDIAPEPAGDNAITGADLSKVAGSIGSTCPF